MNILPERITDGTYLVDTLYLNREEYAASYILRDNNEVAIIETNTNFAIPRILSGLQELDIKKEQVKFIILTHIHLDHAGGAGLLIKELPEAKLILHSRGRKHMISPEKLIESVKSVYGEQEYKKMYGNILPIDKDRIHSIQNEETVNLGNRKLFIFETHGHAKHHISIFDKTAKVLFSGDSFGIGYKIFKYGTEQLLFPSTSPTQFEPDKAIETIDKSINLKPDYICLTHYGQLTNIHSAGKELKEWINFLMNTGTKLYDSGLRDKDLSKTLKIKIFEKFYKMISKYRNSALTEEEKKMLDIDFTLNADGVTLYIEKIRQNSN